MSTEVISDLRPQFYNAVSGVVRKARTRVCRAVNVAMVETYWNVGRLIFEEEQQGAARAQYAAYLISNLANRLTQEFGSGYGKANLKNFRQFYLAFPMRGDRSIGYTLCSQLTWSHYRALMRVPDQPARYWYMREAASRGWSVRDLLRQISSFAFERTLRKRRSIRGRKRPAEKVNRRSIEPREFIHLFIDLVFYNYILKCFVLVDLKSGELTHQDIGQMDMYVRVFEDKVKGDDDNPTVGLILCSEKDRSLVKYSVLNESRQLFASKYQSYLPSEDEIRAEIEKGRDSACDIVSRKTALVAVEPS